MTIKSKGLWLISVAAISFVASVMSSQVRAGTGEVMGIVTTPENSPVLGVTVSLVDSSNRNKVFRIETNAQGRFTISRIPPGRYELTVAKSGFARVPHLAPPVSVTVANGQPVAGVRLAMAPSYGFSGRVLDEGGNPVSSISVSLMRETYSATGVRWLSAIVGATVPTNGTGQYRFSDIAPGEYYVVATPNSANARFMNSFYPGVSSPENATPIKALPGTSEDRFDFSLVRGARYSVRVTAPPPAIVGSGGGSPTFSLKPAGRGRLQTSFNQQTMFEALGGNVYVSPPVPPDSYTLDVVWGTQNRARAAVEVVDRDVDLGTVIPKPALSITVRFFGPTGVSANTGSFSLESLEPETGSVLVSSISRAVSSISRDGTFKLDDVPEGRYVVALSSNLTREKRFIASARLGGHEVVGDVFELNEGSSKNLEITFNGATGSVYGLLQNSRQEGVAFGRVVLMPPRDRRDNSRMFLTTMSDHMGAFSLDAVPPGEYDVLAWDYVEEFAYLNADFLRGLESRATRIRIDSGARSRFLVNVIEALK